MANPSEKHPGMFKLIPPCLYLYGGVEPCRSDRMAGSFYCPQHQPQDGECTSPLTETVQDAEKWRQVCELIDQVDQGRQGWLKDFWNATLTLRAVAKREGIDTAMTDDHTIECARCPRPLASVGALKQRVSRAGHYTVAAAKEGATMSDALTAFVRDAAKVQAFLDRERVKDTSFSSDKERQEADYYESASDRQKWLVIVADREATIAAYQDVIDGSVKQMNELIAAKKAAEATIAAVRAVRDTWDANSDKYKKLHVADVVADIDRALAALSPPTKEPTP